MTRNLFGDIQYVGVVGNQKGWTYDFVKKKLLELDIDHETILVSGGAEGVDTHAQTFAKEFGNTIIIHYPKPHIKSPERYFQSNKDIVDSSHIIVAFDKKSGRAGTKNTIAHAKKANKVIFLYKDEEDEE